MNRIQLEALKRSRVFLVENIVTGVLWDHLVGNDVFTSIMLEYFTCKDTRSAQVRAMLTDLNRRPYEAYDNFLKCLKDTGQNHCAEEILKNQRIAAGEMGIVAVQEISQPPGSSQVAIGPFKGSNSDSTSKQNDVEMKPAGWTASPQNSGSIGPIRQESVQGVYSVQKQVNSEGVYKMESTPRGHMLIINNHTFDFLSEREGTFFDEQDLKELFTDLGYTVWVHRNLTAEEMRQKLVEFSKWEELAFVDSMVIAILTHGGTLQMYGTDASGLPNDTHYITDSDLTGWFGNKNCPLLKGKPKLFLIQACRGPSEDTGVTIDWPVSSDTSVPRTASGQSLSTYDTDLIQDPDERYRTNVPDGGEPGSSLPNPTDMVLAHSSVKGFVSYRKRNEGSVFIRSVVNVFRRLSHERHVNDMFTQVNREVAMNFNTPDEMRFCQMPSPTNLLLKDWYLNPMCATRFGSSSRSFHT